MQSGKLKSVFFSILPIMQQNWKDLKTGASELHFNYAAIRSPAYFDGLLKVLQVLNIDYDMADLSKASAETLKQIQAGLGFQHR